MKLKVLSEAQISELQVNEKEQKSIQKPFQFRLGMKYGMVSVKEWDKKFFFEKQ